MSSLPHISHHLFVAAVGNEGRPPAKPAPDETASVAAAPKATAIPLELLDGGKPTPAETSLQLSAASRAAN